MGWLGYRLSEDWTAMGTLALVAGGVILAVLIHTAVRYQTAVFEAQLVQKIIVDLRSKVYTKLQRLSFRFFDANESGSIINRVTSDVQSVRLFIDHVLIEVLILALALTLYMNYMLNIHVGLTLACLASTPLLWAGVAMFSRIVRPAYRRSRRLVDQMVLRLTENIQGIHVVKGFARQSDQIAGFRQANHAVKQQQGWIFWRVSTFVPSITYLTHINQTVLLGYGGYLVIQNKMPLGSGLIVFAGILQQLSARVTAISHIANSVQRSLTGAGRVFEVLDTPEEITSLPHAKPLSEAHPGVRFEHVGFRYSEGQPVLDDINLEVGPGQCLAILGATGSGKSTLLSLIPRFYDATTGRVMVGDTDVRELDVESLRQRIGVVFQESFLFSNTIAANIAFGHPEADMEQIEQAARIAAAHEFITELPDGYNTVIGENGVDLSGGQRQRLAIARAVLLDPPILLLDDPTAGVDPDTEQQILAAMEHAAKGRATVVVTHRLSTLRQADTVVVMEQGRIVQAGTHEELIAVNGPYRQTALLQGDHALGKHAANTGWEESN
jgi:ATP-binding cassette subfamily B protein